MTRVLIVSRQDIILAGLTLAIEDETDAVFAASTGADAAREARSNRADVAVVDVAPGGDSQGLGVIKYLRRRCAALPVLAFAAHTDAIALQLALEAGAVDHLPYSTPAAQLILAIRETAAGLGAQRKAAFAARAEAAAAKLKTPRGAPVMLTAREADVARCLARGMSNRQIGASVNISEETVKEFVQKLLRKLGLKNRTQVAVWAYRHGVE